jgi:hypothetical protein
VDWYFIYLEVYFFLLASGCYPPHMLIAYRLVRETGQVTATAARERLALIHPMIVCICAASCVPQLFCILINS